MAATQIRGSTQIKGLTITNAEIATSAGIATSKLAQGAEFLLRNGSVVWTGNFDAGTFRLTNLGAPVGANDAARKADVDAAVSGLTIKDSVRVATTANITLSNLQTIDGITLVAGDRVLVKNQTSGEENGLYLAVDAGPWTRTTDFDNASEIVRNSFVFVAEGSVNADTGWTLTNDTFPVTVNTTPLTFTQFSSQATTTNASNVNVDGVGVFKQKNGNTFEFRGVNAADSTITVTLDASNNEIDLAVGQITNTNVAVGAAIDRSKLASGTANRIVINNGSGVIAENIALTVNRALVSDGSGLLATSATTNTELGYVSGVTSAIQTQLNGKVDSVDIVTRETPSGLVNGANTNYTLANTPVVGSETVFLNGILQDEGVSLDYTISGGTITFNAAPQTNDSIKVNYRIA